MIVDISAVVVGDIFVVRPGEQIPVDGDVIEGHSAVNESALTGESIPADKEVGDKVSAGTMNTSGYLKCVATRVGEDTTLAKIIKFVEEAQSKKAPISKTNRCFFLVRYSFIWPELPWQPSQRFPR